MGKKIKEQIFMFYQANKLLLNNDIILSKYMEAAVKNSHTRRLFTNSVDEFSFKIEKDILCASNNIKYSVLSDLAARLDLPYADFSNYLDNTSSENITNIMVTVESLHLSGMDINMSRNSENILNYLDIIVEQRNRISHEYKMSQKFSITQLRLFIDFFDHLELVFLDYLNSQIPLLEKNKVINECDNNQYSSTTVKKIIRSNTGNKRVTLILHINPTENNFIVNSKIMIFKKLDNKKKSMCEFGQIKKIVNDQSQEIREYTDTQQVTIEVETNLSIRQGCEDQLLVFFLNKV